MKPVSMKSALAFAILAALLSSTPAGAADEYPARPITLIVPFAAGGSSDVIARVVAEQVSQVLKQPILIENMPGAGGSLALARTARATPDGYTLAIGNTGTNAAAYTIYPDLKYTPDAFAPIALVAKTSAILAVKKDHVAKTLAEFVDYAKKNPGRATLGHAGIGSSNFIVCKTFIQAAAIDVTLVSYRGAAPALNDLMGGQIDGVCDAAASISSAVESGQVRGLAVASPSRLANLPNLPTAAEAGLPAFQAQGWNAFFAPKGTPEPIIAKLNAAARAALAGDKLQKRLIDLGATGPSADEMSPDYTRTLVAADIEKLRKLLEGVKPPAN
jgi:tripartite-type tricarboxylate transporter receptor subunit TctC